MIRNLKILGLASLGVLVLAAVAASAASAANGTITSDGPVTLLGEETGGTANNQFTAFASNIRCPGSSLTIHKYNETPHNLVPSDTDTATITWHHPDVGCTATALNLPATIDMNGCDWVPHFGETVAGKTDTYSILATTVCTAGNHVKMTVFNAAKTATVCTITFTENVAGYTGLEAVDTTTGDVDIVGTATGISVDEEGTLCGTHSESGATMKTDMTIRGINEAGELTSIGLSHL